MRRASAPTGVVDHGIFSRLRSQSLEDRHHAPLQSINLFGNCALRRPPRALEVEYWQDGPVQAAELRMERSIPPDLGPQNALHMAARVSAQSARSPPSACST
eukprot:3218537-Alexandrium_andersonii.AAC.1